MEIKRSNIIFPLVLIVFLVSGCKQAGSNEFMISSSDVSQLSEGEQKTEAALQNPTPTIDPIEASFQEIADFYSQVNVELNTGLVIICEDEKWEISQSDFIFFQAKNDSEEVIELNGPDGNAMLFRYDSDTQEWEDLLLNFPTFDGPRIPVGELEEIKFWYPFSGSKEYYFYGDDVGGEETIEDYLLKNGDVIRILILGTGEDSGKIYGAYKDFWVIDEPE